MDHNTYKAYLKNQYLHKIRPLQSANQVIAMFQQKIDMVATTLSEAESIYLKMTAINYAHAHQDISIEKFESLNYVSYAVSKNEKSDYYYNHVKQYTNDCTRIIIIVVPQLNIIISNCIELELDMHIERGIDLDDVKQDTDAFFTYLMHFDTQKEYRNITG